MIIKQIHSMSNVSAECWNSLLADKDPFLRHEFLLALEQSTCVSKQTGWQPNHLLVYKHDELIAAMPLYLKTHSWGEYVFDQQWADAYYQSDMAYYPKWVNAIPFTPCSGLRLLLKQENERQAVIDMCISFIQEVSEQNNISSLHSLFPADEEVEYLKPLLLIRQGVQFQWFNRNYADFNDYLQYFTSRQRKNIKKQRRKILEQGLQLERLSGDQISRQQWQVFFTFYESTYLKRGQYPYLNLQFFEQLAVTMPEQILLVLAYKDERAVGAALSFLSDDTLYGRYWGSDGEYKNLHFETCYYQGLEYCMEQGLTRFDSGAQGEHKISRGFEPVLTYSAHWIQNSHFSNLIANFLKEEQAYIQQYKQQCCQFLPFNTRRFVESS